MKSFISLFILILLGFQAQAQYRTVSGMVADSSLTPIPDVNIYITNGSVVGRTDANGYFFFELREGSYELIFSHRDYQTSRLNVVLSGKNDTINLILQGLVKEISGATISAKWRDPGPEMMRKAIDKKEYWASRMPANSCDAYIRAFEEYQKPKKREKVWSEKKTTKSDSVKKVKEEEVSANMAEILLHRDFMPPDKVKEVREAVSIRGDRSGLFYTTTTEGEFQFYTNLVKIPALSDLPVMSPLSNTAFTSYKFNFLGSYKDAAGRRILKIKVTPRLISNSVFSGEIHLVDSLFYIYRLDLHYPETQLNEYNDFIISQEYKLTSDTFLQISGQRFDYYAKAGKAKYSGYTLVQYSNFQMPKEFPKGYFGPEVSATAKEAYERDTAYWNQKRGVPLNSTETRFVSRVDSVKRAHSTEEYLDSMEKITNKVTLKKLLLTGQVYENRKKGITLGFPQILFIVQPWFPGGTRINVWNTVTKEFKSKRNINFIENLSYGINNKDLRGTVIFNTLFDPFHSGLIYLSAGRDFAFINNNAAFLDLARRNNFYQNSHFSAYLRRELFNGFYARIRTEISERKDISGFTFDPIGDQLFENNAPSVFGTHRAFIADLLVNYTPFQKYIREPKRKVVLGSLWPTVYFQYSRGIPGIMQAKINYDYLEYGLNHEFRLGLLGRSELKVTSGSFLTKKAVSLIDYRYQRRGDVYLFTPPMYAFQTLDSTFFTFKRFGELHYRHHFNGALVNKVPILKPLGLRESVGVNLLYAPERRGMFFYEFYAGFDKLIKVWRERFKLGIYYAAGYSNIYEKPIYGFKFNFEFYDRRDNSW